MSLEQYLSFIENDLQPAGGYYVGSKYYSLAYENKKKLHEFLKGPSRTENISIENIQQELEHDVLVSLTNPLLVNIPKYFCDYNFTRQSLKLPVIPSGDFKGYKWSTHISHWLKRNKTLDIDRTLINNTISKLGIAWNKAKSEKKKYIVKLNTDPLAFAKIGLYGVDSQSCFRQTACNQTHKFILGIDRNSFILEFYRESDNKQVVARALGLCDDDFKSFYVFNIYHSLHEKIGNLLAVIDEFFKILLDTDKYSKTDGRLIIKGIYQNKTNNLIYSTNKRESAEKIIPVSSYFASGAGTCLKCGRTTYKEDLTDNHCSLCFKHLKTCAYSGKRTSNVRKVISEDGNEIEVSVEYIGTIFVPVRFKTGYKYLHRNLTKMTYKRNYITIDSYKGRGYADCESCGYAFKATKNARSCPTCSTFLTNE